MKNLFWRIAPSLVLLLLFAGFALLWALAPDIYFALLRHAGFVPTETPLSDARSVLQAMYCWRAGVNVYVANPCMNGGVYNYSPFLLHLASIVQLPRRGFAVGMGMDVLFIAALCWLPLAQTRAELVLRIAAACSGSVVFALERGNIDTGMFVLAVLGIRLIRRTRAIGLAGYALFLLGAACKFYPVALLLLAWRERPRHLLLLAVPGLLALALYVVLFGGASAVALHILPVGLPFEGVFGALNLPFGVWLFGATHTLSPNLAEYMAAISHPGLAFGMQIFLEVLALALLAVAVRLAPFWGRTFEQLTEEHRLFLVGGAAVVVFCFFLAQNIPYRAIFLLLPLPGLYRMADAGMPWMRTTCIAILFLLWQDACQDALRALTAGWPAPVAATICFLFWLAAQFVWWGCVFVLTSMIVCFLRSRLRNCRRHPAIVEA
jgi:hypothetical protein